MSQETNGPASATNGNRPSENTPATKLLASQDSGTAPQSGDSQRQLGRGILDGSNLDVRQRLADAASQAADWTARGLIDRTAAVCVVSVAAQAVGIGQSDALAVIRGAFHEAGAR